MNNPDINKVKEMTKATENTNGVARWKNLITLMIAVVVLGGSAVGYALNAKANKEHPHTNLVEAAAFKDHAHPNLVRFREMESIRIEIKTVRADIAELRDEVREIRKMLMTFISGKG